MIRLESGPVCRRRTLQVVRDGSLSLLASFAVVLTGCGDRSDVGPRGSVQRADSSGVEIVRSSGRDRPLDWTLEEVLRIGPADEGPEAFFRVDDDGIAVDAEGRIYVLDDGAVEVKVFDRDGTHLRTLAREGEGPGEMEEPVSLFVSPDGEVSVLAQDKRAFVRFAPDGSVLEEVRLPGVAARTARSVPVSSGGVVMVTDTLLSESRVPRPGSPYRIRLLLFRPEADADWSEPVELGVMEAEQPSFTLVGAPDCPFKIRMPPVFSREPVWAVARNGALYNGSDEYRVDITRLDGTRRSIRRDLPVMSAARERAAAEIGPFDSDRLGDVCDATGEERADQAGWADRISWVKEVRLDPSDRVFVLRRAPGEDPSERIDVFEDDGAYAGTLPADFPLPEAWRGPDEIVLRRGDDLDRLYLVVYEIHRD